MTQKKLILMALMGVMLSDADAGAKKISLNTLKSSRARAGRPVSAPQGGRPVSAPQGGIALDKLDGEGETEEENKEQDPKPASTEKNVTPAIDLDKEVDISEDQAMYLDLKKKTSLRDMRNAVIGRDNADGVPRALVSDFKAFAESIKRVEDYMNPLVLQAINSASSKSLAGMKNDPVEFLQATNNEGVVVAGKGKITIGGVEVANQIADTNFSGDANSIQKKLGTVGTTSKALELQRLENAFDDLLENAKKAVILVDGQEKTLGDLGLNMPEGQFTVAAMNSRYDTGKVSTPYMNDQAVVKHLVAGNSDEVLHSAISAPFQELVAKIGQTIQDAAGKTKKGIHLPIFLANDAESDVINANNIKRVSVNNGVKYKVDSTNEGRVFLATIAKPTGRDARQKMITVKDVDLKNVSLSSYLNLNGTEKVKVGGFGSEFDGVMNTKLRTGGVQVDALFNSTAKALLTDMAPKFHTKKTDDQKGYKQLDDAMLLKSIAETKKALHSNYTRAMQAYNNAKTAEERKELAKKVANAVNELYKLDDSDVLRMTKNSRTPKKAQGEDFVL